MGHVVEVYEGLVVPALFAGLDIAFPEFDWRRHGRGWRAGPRAAAWVLAALGTDSPQKIVCGADSKWGYYCHKGGQTTTWAAHVAGGPGTPTPSGAAFVAAVKKLAELAGVDAGLDGPAIDPEERERRLAEAAQRAEAQRRIDEANRAREDERAIADAWRTWEAAAVDDAVLAYVRSRGLDADLLAGACRAVLRVGPMFVAEDGREDPQRAVLCPVVSAEGEFRGLQRIAIDDRGAGERDANGAKIKKMLGRPHGGAVRIGPAGHGPLWLCEGVETALAVHQATGGEVWAALSASGLLAVDLNQVPIDRPVRIAADLDLSGTGQDAGEELEMALRDAGRPDVRLALPGSVQLPALVVHGAEGDRPRRGKSVDWLDVVAGAEGGAALLAGYGASLPGVGVDEDNGDRRPILWHGQTHRARLALNRVWGYPRGRRGRRRFRLVYWLRLGHWYEFDGRVYQRVQDEMIVARLQDFFHGFDVRVKKPVVDDRTGELVDQKYAAVNTGELGAIADQLRAGVLCTELELPVWAPGTYDGDRPVYEHGAQGAIDDAERPAPEALLNTRSGLLRLDAWDRGEVEILPHTPRFLSTQMVPHEIPAREIEAMLAEDPGNETLGFELWSRHAPTFAAYLDRICEGDERKTATLIEWLGYCLDTDVTLEKALLLTGPPGSGKGTYETALRAMLGPGLVGSTSMTKIVRPFHTASLLGVLVAVIQDAHVNDFNEAAALETVKSIASGDPIGVEEKYGREDGRFVLRTKLMICCNELPRFNDPSGSWAQRLVVVPMVHGHRRSMDRSIKAGIAKEGQGILLAALFGRRRLRANGAFTQPADGAELLRQYEMDNAPVQMFVEHCCELGAEHAVDTRLLYTLYRSWAVANGRREMNDSKFGEFLRMAVPNRERRERQVGGVRYYHYTGIRPRVSNIYGGGVVTDMSHVAEMDFDVRDDSRRHPDPAPPFRSHKR
jgi:P4 family phage/plasmid primase-like protien